MKKIYFSKMKILDLEEVMEIELSNYPVAWSKGVMQDCIKAGYQCIVVKHSNCETTQKPCHSNRFGETKVPRPPIITEPHSEKIIGHAFLMVNLDEAHLLNMCIDKTCQSKGYGRKLLKYLENICLYNQSQAFLLEVRESNPIAYALYKSFGFEKIGVRKNYYRTVDGREDAIVMVKQL